MKAVVDDKIPFIRPAIEQLMDEVVYLPGKQISPADVRDADVLLVRTRTHCNRTLLEGSRVRLVVTATIGFDHLDTQYLDKAGIEWHNCPGCNATSVAQYVHNCLLLLEREKGLRLKDCTLGIIGVGHVGSEVLKACRPLVKRILPNDPPKESIGLSINGIRKEDLSLTSLSTLQKECDIITIHTPLVTDGLWPTYHLADKHFFQHLERRPVIINSGRGEVVDNQALLQALNQGVVREAIIDTWEGEPAISLPLLNKVYIGTPHIAGYSADGKANATRMTLEAVCRWMGVGCTFSILPPALPQTMRPAQDFVDQTLQLYDPRRDSELLKSNPSDFEKQRGNYPLRREKWD